MTAYLVEDCWYWVRTRESEWFPAIHVVSAAGGWSNGDTWEDFDKEVVEWCLILLPE
jgi:hypothetical protein